MNDRTADRYSSVARSSVAGGAVDVIRPRQRRRGEVVIDARRIARRFRLLARHVLRFGRTKQGSRRAEITTFAEYGAGGFHWLREPTSAQPELVQTCSSERNEQRRTRIAFARASGDRSPFPSAGSVRGERRFLNSEQGNVYTSISDATRPCGRRCDDVAARFVARQNPQPPQRERVTAARQSHARTSCKLIQLGGSVKLGSALPPRIFETFARGALREAADSRKRQFPSGFPGVFARSHALHASNART